MAIDTEEMIRAQPMDACVLIGGCDKTVPALLMGAASANVPAIMLVTGPMLTGDHKVSGWRVHRLPPFLARFRAGEIDAQESARSKPSSRHGRHLHGDGNREHHGVRDRGARHDAPGGACIPAVMSERMRNAEATGARAVAIAKKDSRPTRS